MIARLQERSANPHGEPWDVVVIGGGATGGGVAVVAGALLCTGLHSRQHDRWRIE